jgi:RNA polymerase sigma-70 factor (ECF subfamily)
VRKSTGRDRPDPRGREALREALVANADDLTAYFERRVQPRTDAADLLAETMLQAWRRVDALPRGDETGRRMWLFAIASHVLSNHRRSRGRHAALAERLRDHLRMTSPAHGADPTVEVAVRDAIQRLPAQQRELVMLVHWDGFNLAEAARVLGINPSTARGRYGAARDALRSTLSDNEHNEWGTRTR